MANKPVICANGKFREADPGATIAPEHLGLQDLIKAGPNVKLEYGTDGTITIVDVCCDAPAAPDVNNDGIVIDGVEFVPGSGGSANGVTEGERATLRVRFSEPLRAAGQVAFALSGTEFTAHPAYYMQVQSASPVAVQAGATHVDIAIQTTDDQIDEPDLRMDVAFTFNGSTKNGGFGVKDNDDAPLVCAYYTSFASLVGNTVEEGQIARFQLTLSQPYPGAGPATFPVSFSGSHVQSNPSMYPVKHVPVNPGDQTIVFEVPVHRDGLTNGNTTLVVTLFQGQQGCESANNPSTSLTITNTDQAEHPATKLRSVSAVASTVTEGQTATFRLTFSQTPDANAVTVIPYRYSGSEYDTHPSRYPAGSVSVPAGATTADVTIQTYDDTIIESEKELKLELWPAEPTYTRSATARVIDNDSVQLRDVVRITASPSPAREGEQICYTFTRINSHLHDGEIRLNLHFSGSEVNQWPSEPAYPTPVIVLSNGADTAQHCFMLYSDGQNTGDRELRLDADTVSSGVSGNIVVNTRVIDTSVAVDPPIGATVRFVKEGTNTDVDGLMPGQRVHMLIEVPGSGQHTMNFEWNHQGGNNPFQSVPSSETFSGTARRILLRALSSFNEEFRATTVTMTKQGTTGSSSDNIGVINPNAGVSIVPFQNASTITEGQQARWTIRRNSALPEDHVYNAELYGTEQSVHNYTAPAVRFPAHETLIVVGVNTIDDNIDEDTTTLGLRLLGLGVEYPIEVLDNDDTVAPPDNYTVTLTAPAQVNGGDQITWTATANRPVENTPLMLGGDWLGESVGLFNHSIPVGQTSVSFTTNTSAAGHSNTQQCLQLNRNDARVTAMEYGGGDRRCVTIARQDTYRVVSVSVTPAAIEAGSSTLMTWIVTLDRPVTNTPLDVTSTWSGTHQPPTGQNYNFSIPVGQNSHQFDTVAQGPNSAGNMCFTINTDGRLIAVNY